MTLGKSVLGVLGMCWVDFANPTHFRTVNPGPPEECVGCVGFNVARTRMRAKIFTLQGFLGRLIFSYAMDEKPNTPNTPNTLLSNTLVLKSFYCVGFVLGLAFLCWVGGEA